MWSAEQRQDRSPPAVDGHSGHTPSRVLRWVSEDRSDSAELTKPRQTDDQRRERRELKEKGEACMRCCHQKKSCDRDDPCWRCRLPQPGSTSASAATLCFRGIERLWLWRAVEQDSLELRSRKKALRRARDSTFDDSSRQLRELPRLGQALPGTNMFLVVYLTSKLGDSKATSRIAMSLGPLAGILQSMPNILTNQFKTALAAHIPNPVLPSLQNDLTQEETSLLGSAHSACRVYNFLSNAAHVKYHASLRNISSALDSGREISCFLMEYCARLLAIAVEEVLEKIRAMVRRYKSPGNVVKHAFGLYHAILAGLKLWNTGSALDIIMEPLVTRTLVVMADLELLYRNIYGSMESLQDFVDSNIPVMAEIKDLHLSHDIQPASDNAITSWNLISDRFHKDFLVDLRGLLVLDGQVAWISELHSVQRSGFSPRRIDAAATSPLPRGGSEASEPGPSPRSIRSPSATLIDSFWGDGSTFIQSPSEAAHGAELGHASEVQVGDVKNPQDLVGVSGDMGTHTKRGLSPRSTSSSPPPKRTELDAWLANLDDSEHRFFDEEYAAIMQAR